MAAMLAQFVSIYKFMKKMIKDWLHSETCATKFMAHSIRQLRKLIKGSPRQLHESIWT